MKKKLSKAMIFITLLGVVSMFSDMTHEGASSIRGAYLSLLGASASTIGFISGLGELVGYGLRYIVGIFTDKSKKYWLLTIVGYVIDVLAVPALALVNENGWILACFLLILERVGKAIKKPAKNTILSFAAKQEKNSGKAFAYQEALDQFGAFLGPLILYVIMLFKKGSQLEVYQTCFAFLAIPAFICIFILLIAHSKFPHPEEFESDDKEDDSKKVVISKKFLFYLIGISLFAFGFIDFSLINMHVAKLNIFDINTLPLLYSLAMLIDAIAAVLFGNLYDSKGMKALILSTLLATPFSFFVFFNSNKILIYIGIIMWGIGMGAQESILKAVVADIVNKENRGQGYGFFELAFGIFWFLGSWLCGRLYEINIIYMIIVSIVCELLAVLTYKIVDICKG